MSTLKACFWLWLLATPVLAGGPAADPTYIGLRSNNPEQETYGVPVDSSAFARPLAFVGPARSIGPATGDPEKELSPTVRSSSTHEGARSASPTWSLSDPASQAASPRHRFRRLAVAH